MNEKKIVATVASSIANRLKRFTGKDKDFPLNFEKRFGKGDDKYLITLKVWRTPPTIGYTSFFHRKNCDFDNCKCSLDKQVYFAEYDNTTLAELFKIYTPIVKSGDLPFVFFIQTRADAKHYHVVSPCLFTRAEKIRLMFAAKVSTRYTGFGISINRHTLRWAPKDKRKFQLCYVSGLVSHSIESKKPLASMSHLYFMQKVYDIPEQEAKKYRSLPCNWVEGRIELDRYYATNFMKKGAKEK